MNWNYIAGFFDGEGHARTNVDCRRGTKSFTVRFTQNDPTVLEEIQLFLYDKGISSGLYYHEARPDKNKPNGCWTLAVQRVDDVERLLKLLYRRVIVKRDQIDSVLTDISERRAYVKRKVNSIYKTGAKIS